MPGTILGSYTPVKILKILKIENFSIFYTPVKKSVTDPSLEEFSFSCLFGGEGIK